MARDIEDMGEEEVRARMEIAKIKIAGALGIVFSSLLGASYVFVNKGLSYAILVAGLGVLALYIVGIPSRERYYALAKKLDNLPKLEEHDELNKKGGGNMAEILKKNEIKARMEIRKIGLQAIIIVYFGLVLKQLDVGKTFKWEIAVAIIVLFVGFVILGLSYMKKAKELDKEEAKERELKT